MTALVHLSWSPPNVTAAAADQLAARAPTAETSWAGRPPAPASSPKSTTCEAPVSSVQTEAASARTVSGPAGAAISSGAASSLRTSQGGGSIHRQPEAASIR